MTDAPTPTEADALGAPDLLDPLLDDVLAALAAHGEHPPRDRAAAWLEDLLHDA